MMERRRRLRRRKGRLPPPTSASPGQMTTCHRVPLECRAAPGRLQWPAVTHCRPPVAPESWGQDPCPAACPLLYSRSTGRTGFRRQSSAAVTSKLHATPLGSSQSRLSARFATSAPRSPNSFAQCGGCGNSEKKRKIIGTMYQMQGRDTLLKESRCSSALLPAADILRCVPEITPGRGRQLRRP